MKKEVANAVKWYIGGVEYTHGDLEAVYHEESRLIKNGSNWQFEYTIADHLGNARVSFADKDEDSIIEDNNDEILQTQSYYPCVLEFCEL